MPLFSWNKEMSVDIALLDEDHQKIINMINKLYDAIIVGEGEDVLAEIFDMMSVYIHTHFESEAQLFKHIDYPEAAQHIELHEELSRKVAEARIKFNTAHDSTLPTETMVFLKEWWTNHIMNHDMKYVAFMRENRSGSF